MLEESIALKVVYKIIIHIRYLGGLLSSAAKQTWRNFPEVANLMLCT
jgi:hypothetical protein